MIDADDDKVFNRYESIYGTQVDGKNPAQQAQIKIDEIFTKDLSEPLKKLHIQFLSNVVKNCYPEKHLREDFTNYEQISLCKEQERQKLFGKFEYSLTSTRDSGINCYFYHFVCSKV